MTGFQNPGRRSNGWSRSLVVGSVVLARAAASKLGAERPGQREGKGPGFPEGLHLDVVSLQSDPPLPVAAPKRSREALAAQQMCAQSPRVFRLTTVLQLPMPRY